jgi:hypothetical protein
MSHEHWSLDLDASWNPDDGTFTLLCNDEIVAARITTRDVSWFHGAGVPDAERSPAGEGGGGAAVAPDLPSTSAGSAETAADVQDYDERMLQMAWNLGAGFETQLERLGQALDVRNAFIRFQIWMSDDAVWRVPLELALINGSSAVPLALEPGRSIVRVWPSPRARPLIADQRLRLVGSFVEGPSINVDEDRRAFERAIEAARRSSSTVRLDAVVTDGRFDGPNGLQSVLTAEPDVPTVLIVSGHGNPGLVEFRDRTVTSSEVAELVDQTDTRLVVLAICSGAQAPDVSTADQHGDHVDIDTARSLVAAGVPAVVGMAAPVGGDSATRFVDGFLADLLGGAIVDEAVRSGRRKMHSSLWRAGTRRDVRALPRLVVGVPSTAFARSSCQPLRPAELRVVPAADEPSSAAGARQVRSLPAAPAFAVGRHDTIQHIADRFGPGREPGQRLVHGVIGRRGVGKSHVARAVADASSADIVWWIRADDDEAVLDGFEQLHQRLGLPEPPRGGADDRVARAEAVRAHLSGMSSTSAHLDWLLVFDNLPGDAADARLRAWAPATGNGAVLATFSGELGWDHPTTLLEPLGADDAVALLAARTGETDTPELRELAEWLECLPLALVQIGGLMRETLTGPERMLDRLRTAPDVLARGDQTTMAAVVRQSLQQLKPTDRALYSALCHLQLESIPLELVRSESSAAVLNRDRFDLDDALGAFRALALVQVDRRRATLRIHRLTALLTRQLVATGDPDGSATVGSARSAASITVDRSGESA